MFAATLCGVCAATALVLAPVVWRRYNGIFLLGPRKTQAEAVAGTWWAAFMTTVGLRGLLGVVRFTVTMESFAGGPDAIMVAAEVRMQSRRICKPLPLPALSRPVFSTCWSSHCCVTATPWQTAEMA